MSKTYCKNCEYWDNSETFNAKTEDEGFCHYWPPTNGQNNVIGAMFPKTKANFWCGQGSEIKEEVLTEG